MPTVTLRTDVYHHNETISNKLPSLLQTPGGLAIVEVQGTIHSPATTNETSAPDTLQYSQTPIGRLEFPLYKPTEDKDKDGRWMKKVYLYIGRFQRLTGEVKKLGKPLVVIGKREQSNDFRMQPNGRAHEQTSQTEELEVLEVVKYKILFSSRPEPVGE